MASDAGKAVWSDHQRGIRAYVEGLASGFAAEPGRRWTGAQLEHLLLAMLDKSDADFDHFDLPPDLR